MTELHSQNGPKRLEFKHGREPSPARFTQEKTAQNGPKNNRGFSGELRPHGSTRTRGRTAYGHGSQPGADLVRFRSQEKFPLRENAGKEPCAQVGHFAREPRTGPGPPADTLTRSLDVRSGALQHRIDQDHSQDHRPGPRITPGHDRPDGHRSPPGPRARPGHHRHGPEPARARPGSPGRGQSHQLTPGTAGLASLPGPLPRHPPGASGFGFW